METLDLRGSATLGQSGLISNNEGDTLTLLHTKYISIGPRRCFKSFPIISLWELYVAMEFKSKQPKPNAAFLHYKAMETLNPQGGAILGPRMID